MVVVVADHIPDAIRGKMKLWFTELKPNVFVSGIKDAVANNVINYLFSKADFLAGMTIVTSIPQPPWYRVVTLGSVKRRVKTISGMQLVYEKFSAASNK
jgi:CRISPR-associated protein Cas2